MIAKEYSSRAKIKKPSFLLSKMISIAISGAILLLAIPANCNNNNNNNNPGEHNINLVVYYSFTCSPPCEVSHLNDMFLLLIL